MSTTNKPTNDTRYDFLGLDNTTNWLQIHSDFRRCLLTLQIWSLDSNVQSLSGGLCNPSTGPKPFVTTDDILSGPRHLSFVVRKLFEFLMAAVLPVSL